MTQIVKYFCDICQIECFVKDGLGTFAGFIRKVDRELKNQNISFEGHYCASCVEEILKFISKLKDNAKDSNIATVGE